VASSELEIVFAVPRLRVLQVDDDASQDEIKAAYRQLAKVCHPDSAGDAGHNICILLNAVRGPVELKRFSPRAACAVRAPGQAERASRPPARAKKLHVACRQRHSPGTVRASSHQHDCMMQAYDTLMNARARKAYDTQLEVALQDDEDGFTGAQAECSARTLSSAYQWPQGTLCTQASR
jgi:DnaJ domain